MNKLIIPRNQDIGGTQIGIQGLTHELTLLHPDWILRLKTKRTVYKCCVSFFLFFFFCLCWATCMILIYQTQALGSESWKPGVLTTGQPGNSLTGFFFSFFKIVFIYLFLTVLGLCCCAWVFSSCISQASHCSGFSCGLSWCLKQLRNACHAGDPGSTLGSGRSLGEGNDNPLQCSCLENSMDRGAC